VSTRYGRQHQRIRAALLPLAYGTPCHFCGELMQPGQELHLDHTADGTAYRGMVHAACNVKDGARRGYRRMLERRGVPQGGVF
jgi:hypothetical protein